MERKRHRGGAPKKSDDEKRERRVEVAFTFAEYDSLLLRKSKAKVSNLSVFIRTICLDKPMRMKPQLSTHQENVLSLLREMRADILRIGVNVNQSAKRINNTTDYQNLQSEVSAMAEQVAHFDRQMGALMTTIDKVEDENTSAYGSTNQ
ncbi:plasmid mobilization protein [Spirosoma aerophilum]